MCSAEPPEAEAAAKARLDGFTQASGMRSQCALRSFRRVDSSDPYAILSLSVTATAFVRRVGCVLGLRLLDVTVTLAASVFLRRLACCASSWTSAKAQRHWRQLAVHQMMKPKRWGACPTDPEGETQSSEAVLAGFPGLLKTGCSWGLGSMWYNLCGVASSSLQVHQVRSQPFGVDS